MTKADARKLLREVWCPPFSRSLSVREYVELSHTGSDKLSTMVDLVLGIANLKVDWRQYDNVNDRGLAIRRALEETEHE